MIFQENIPPCNFVNKNSVRLFNFLKCLTIPSHLRLYFFQIKKKSFKSFEIEIKDILSRFCYRLESPTFSSLWHSGQLLYQNSLRVKYVYRIFKKRKKWILMWIISGFRFSNVKQCLSCDMFYKVTLWLYNIHKMFNVM